MEGVEVEGDHWEEQAHVSIDVRKRFKLRLRGLPARFGLSYLSKSLSIVWRGLYLSSLSLSIAQKGLMLDRF